MARFAFVCLLVLLSVGAAKQLEFPGPAHSERIATLQAAADAAYSERKYQQASNIFQQELAPRGDKYAQYMLGHMHQRGEGTPIDPVKAYAWLRLAAQRGQQDLLTTLDAHRKTLSATQIIQGESIYQTINADFGDRSVLRKLIKKDAECLRASTGSRVASDRPRRVFGDNCLGKGDWETKDRVKLRRAYVKSYVEYGGTEVTSD